MNILILSWRGPGHPYAGGAEQVTHEHAKAWISAGHDVTLFTSKTWKTSRKEVIDGVTIVRRGTDILGVQTAAVPFYLLHRPKFDLVIDQFHGIPFFTPFYIKVNKLAFIHEVAKEVWSYNPWPPPLNRLPAYFGPKIEPFVFKYIYREIPFLTVSESTKNDLIHMGIPKTNITVIHNGVNLEVPKKNVSKNKIKTALFLGAIAKDKGVYDAVKAFADIERKDEGWQYWVVGKGGLKEMGELKKLIKSLGLGNKVRYWGFVNDKKKFELLARATVLINPSIHEGWGLINIEANAVSTPVVAYDVHGIRDSVKNGVTGILVKKGDFHSLAQSAIKLSIDTSLYSGLQINAYKWAKKFTWEKAKKESVGLIESL